MYWLQIVGDVFHAVWGCAMVACAVMMIIWIWKDTNKK